MFKKNSGSNNRVCKDVDVGVGLKTAGDPIHIKYNLNRNTTYPHPNISVGSGANNTFPTPGPSWSPPCIANDGDRYSSPVYGEFEWSSFTGWILISPPNPPATSKGQTPQVREEEVLRHTEMAEVDASTVRTALWKQAMILDELSEGVGGPDGAALYDAAYFLREAVEALNKILEQKL